MGHRSKQFRTKTAQNKKDIFEELENRQKQKEAKNNDVPVQKAISPIFFWEDPQNLGGPFFVPWCPDLNKKEVRENWPPDALAGPALRTARGLRRGKGRGLTNPVDKIFENN